MSKHQILIDNGQFMAVGHENEIEFWDSQGSKKYGVLSDSTDCQDLSSAFKLFASGLLDTKTILRQFVDSNFAKFR